jgi:16S rRNA (cytidine1402-2'-O)-methyltransferase
MNGRLLLIPSLLGECTPDRVLPDFTLQQIRSTRYFITEQSKAARAFLKLCEMPCPQQELSVVELDKHDPDQEVDQLLAPALSGNDIGLLSDAGCPGVADPGARIVAAAHRSSIQVVPLVGPSSLLLALMGSGLEGQRFCFHGYLPVDRQERIKRIQQLEDRALRFKETQLFIETPYRNTGMIEDLLKTLSGTTKVCLAADLTLSTEFIRTRSVREWKSQLPDLNKRPCVFLIGG